MKEMGLDPDDFGAGYDDPELAALEKQLRKQGKQLKFISNRKWRGL